MLHEIYGAKSSINPPCVFESGSLVTAGGAYSYNQEIFDIDDLILYDPDKNGFEFDQMNDLIEGDLYAATATSTATVPLTLSTAVPLTNVASTSRKIAIPAAEDTVARFKRSLLTIPVNKPVKQSKPSTAVAVMDDWQTKRATAIKEKKNF